MDEESIHESFAAHLWDLVNRCSEPDFQHYEVCSAYDLSAIATEIETLSPRDIHIGFTSDRTKLNRFKGFVEKYSGHE